MSLTKSVIETNSTNLVFFEIPENYQAIIYEAPEKLKLIPQKTESLNAGEILIKIEAAVTNGTDLKAYLRGHPVLLKTLPSRFGHEAVGTVVAKANDVVDFELGDRVVPANSAPCGECKHCQKQQFTLCQNLNLLNGTYAEYLVIPKQIVEKNLYKVPNDIDVNQLLSVESLAVCLRGIEQLNLQGDESVLILGTGPIAMLLAKCASFKTKTICVMGRNPQAVDTAVNYVENPNTTGQIWPKNSDNNLKFDVVIEATGSTEVWEQAIQFVEAGGKLLYFGGCLQGSTFTLPTAPIHYQEVTILGAFHHTPKHFKQAVKMAVDGVINLRPFVSHQMLLSELSKAFEMMKTKQAKKVAIIP